MHSLKEVQTIAVLNCHHRPMAMYLSVVPLIPTKPIGLLCLVVMFLYFVGSVLLITDRGCRFSTFKLLECHSVQCYSFCCVTPGHAFISVPSLFFCPVCFSLPLSWKLLILPERSVLIYWSISSCHSLARIPPIRHSFTSAFSQSPSRNCGPFRSPGFCEQPASNGTWQRTVLLATGAHFRLARV